MLLVALVLAWAALMPVARCNTLRRQKCRCDGEAHRCGLRPRVFAILRREGARATLPARDRARHFGKPMAVVYVAGACGEPPRSPPRRWRRCRSAVAPAPKASPVP